MYLGISRLVGGSSHYYLALGSLQILPHIERIFVETSNGISSSVAFYLNLLSHHTLILFDLTYRPLGPAPDVVPLPLRHPLLLPYISPNRPSYFTITWYQDSIGPSEGTIYPLQLRVFIPIPDIDLIHLLGPVP